MGHTQFFQKKRFQGFILEILRIVQCLLRKLICFQLPWDNENFNSFKLSVHVHVVLLINIPEQFELYFYFRYSRSNKVYN